MFHPPAFQAATLDIPDEVLDDPNQDCLCGHKVKLRGCIALWTTHPSDKTPHWYAACHGNCILAHVTEGNA